MFVMALWRVVHLPEPDISVTWGVGRTELSHFKINFKAHKSFCLNYLRTPDD